MGTNSEAWKKENGFNQGRCFVNYLLADAEVVVDLHVSWSLISSVHVFVDRLHMVVVTHSLANGRISSPTLRRAWTVFRPAFESPPVENVDMHGD